MRSRQPVSKLNSLQTQIHNHILSDTLEAHPEIIGHLEIYYHGYRLRLLEALTMDYPQCEALMERLFGENAFEQAGLEYLKQYPSHHFSVRYFGHSFAKFLAQNKPYSNHPYLHELADFEWSILFCLDAADANTLDINTLKMVPAEQWGDLLFSVHPSVQYKIYQCDITALWKNIEPLPQNKTAIACLFWRKNMGSFFEILPPAHQIFYKSILCGKNFGDICENLLAIMPEDQYDMVPATAVGILQYWIEQGVITQASTNPN